MKYEFTGKTINQRGRILHQIKRLSDGLIGGYIESEENLSQNGDAFVSGNAKVFGDVRVYNNAWVFDNARVSDNVLVFGNARVSDNAKVSDNAMVSGNAKCTKLALYVTLPKHNITLTDDHIAIGCHCYTIKHWIKHIDKIGQENGYNPEEIRAVKYVLKGLLLMRKNNA